MRRRLLTSMVLVLALAAGCGGDDERASEAAWSDDFCSAAADWRSSLDEVIGQFANPSDLSADSVREAIDDGLSATEAFVDDVRALDAPDTEAGEEAAGIVDSMTTTVQSTVDDLRETFDSGDDSLPALIAKLGQASDEIQQMGQELQGSLDQLENLGGELKDDLESNEDCAAARSGGG